MNWVKHYVGPSVGKRVAELPLYGLASIAPGSPRRVRNQIAERNHDRHPFAYSFEIEHVDWVWVSLTWLATLGALWASRPVPFHSVFFRATFAIIAANILIHMFWGPQIFLYSQHWLAFLCFAIVRAIDGRITTTRKWLISGSYYRPRCMESDSCIRDIAGSEYFSPVNSRNLAPNRVHADLGLELRPTVRE